MICRAASLRARRSLNKTLSAQQLSWDSVNGLHIHREEPCETSGKPNELPQGIAKEPEGELGASEAERKHGTEEEHTLEPQPKCNICGITTTSQAHMEVGQVNLPATDLLMLHCAH